MDVDVTALSYHLASRLAYVLYIGVALQRQAARQELSARFGPEAGFRRFRRRAALLMSNDALSFILLCVLTRGTLGTPVPFPYQLAGGLLLGVLGLGVKLWATATLGADAYYWRNFFAGPGPALPTSRGPYRFLKDPMYTVGYLQTYGLALVCDSWPALAASVFDQAMILAFLHLVERPHLRALSRGASTIEEP